MDARELVTPFASVAYAPDKLPAHTSLLAVDAPVSRVWTYAGAGQAPVLVIVDSGRASHFLNLVVLGLFSITGGPEDFLARLSSRNSLGGDEPFNPKLLRDTTHHVSRALAEHFGRRSNEEEKAIVFETLWRHAQVGIPRGAGNDGEPLPRLHFLNDSHTYRWLEDRVRTASVHTIWGSGRSFITSEDARQFLEQRRAPVALVCLGGVAAYDSGTWKRVPKTESCSVTADDLPPTPYSSLVTPAIDEPASAATPHPRDEAFFARCAALGPDGDWASACDALLEAPPEQARLMANALAQALQIDR